jgi:hypothetical protein
MNFKKNHLVAYLYRGLLSYVVLTKVQSQIFKIGQEISVLEAVLSISGYR